MSAAVFEAEMRTWLSKGYCLITFSRYIFKGVPLYVALWEHEPGEERQLWIPWEYKDDPVITKFFDTTQLKAMR
jgi:Bacterial tandem repeat domain 1